MIQTLNMETIPFVKKC